MQLPPSLASSPSNTAPMCTPVGNHGLLPRTSSSPYKAIQGAVAIDSPWFEDFLPSMVARLGLEGLVAELCKGFQLLMDPRSGLITFESLKRCPVTLGLGDDEIRSMLREGDLDGDGAINQMEFCVLMLRLSPELMQEA